MEQVIKGKIVSQSLGEFGKNETIYGYLGIESESGHQVVVKVDNYTWYETLEIGSFVVVDAENLGDTKIIVARKISISPEHALPTSKEVSTTA